MLVWCSGFLVVAFRTCNASSGSALIILFHLMAKKHIDRAALIATIRELKELSNEQKSDILQLISEQKKYGIVWEDSPEDVEENLRVNIPVLVEDKDRAIISNADDAPNHILIEGDNLEALTVLSYTHEGKIDVIYIDPPYNTGNKDFVYNDSFVDSEDGYRHSKWLSFMEKRLRIAKKLLSDKGVIFISIDDNEQANLKLLCDEVLGYDKFVANFIWKSRQNKDNRNITGVSIDHEYVICYSKNTGIRVLQGSERKTEQYKNPDNDPRGPWTSANMAGLLDAEQRPNCHYDLVNPQTGINYGRPKMGWRYDRKTMSKLIDENRIIWPNTSDGRPRKKSFLSEISVVLPGFSSVIGEKIYTRTGTKLLDELFVKRPFDFPKPIELIQELILQSSSKNSIILDFFAGSGTTLHATMQLNAEDGGHRQCILCTNNENNICEEVTYERNKRVINGYTTPKGVEVEGLHDNSLRYYKIKDVPRDSSTTGLKKLMLASTDLLCIKNDLYEEQSVFGNIKLRKNIARYFDDGKQKMLIIYKVDAIESIVEEIKKMPADTFIKVYVFSTNNYAMDADFEEVSDKVFLCALPAAIYNAYRKVLPRKNNVITEEEEE